VYHTLGFSAGLVSGTETYKYSTAEFYYPGIVDIDIVTYYSGN